MGIKIAEKEKTMNYERKNGWIFTAAFSSSGSKDW